jgi:TetR/AcrR family transcriptional regulator, ethionamide resistance regulator
MAVLGQRTGTRAARRADTERRIVRATGELLAGGEGFADLSVERIAVRAGISRPAFYDYFRDKRELLIKLVEDAAAPIFAEADELVRGRPSGPSEIPFTIKAAMKFARGSREVFCAAVEAAAYDEVVARFWRGEVIDRFVEVIERRIRHQQAAGIALPINPRAAAESLVLMVTATLYDHVRGDDGISDRKLVETLVAICVRSVYGPVDDLATRARR